MESEFIALPAIIIDVILEQPTYTAKTRDKKLFHTYVDSKWWTRILALPYSYPHPVMCVCLHVPFRAINWLQRAVPIVNVMDSNSSTSCQLWHLGDLIALHPSVGHAPHGQTPKNYSDTQGVWEVHSPVGTWPHGQTLLWIRYSTQITRPINLAVSTPI